MRLLLSANFDKFIKMISSAVLIGVAVALLLPVASFAQHDNQTYNQLQPASYGVSLSYVIDGNSFSPPPCTSSAPGTLCLPLLYSGDSVIISYAPNTTAAFNSTSKITLKACFGAQSTANRAWRKPSPIITKDAQCSLKIASNLPPIGNYTYIVGPDVALAVYRILALEICNTGAACAMGFSPGYYATEPIDDRPGWLMAMVGVFATIGPLSLLAFFFIERRQKKTK